MPFFLRAILINKPHFILKTKGVSLVEILLVVATVGFLALLVGNLPNSIALIGKAKNTSLAREITSKKIEDLRATLFVNIANGMSVINDQRVSLLPQGSGQTLVEDCDPLICSQGENLKQVTVTITWKEGAKDQKVEIKTLLSQEGLGQ